MDLDTPRENGCGGRVGAGERRVRGSDPTQGCFDDREQEECSEAYDVSEQARTATALGAPNRSESSGPSPRTVFKAGLTSINSSYSITRLSVGKHSPRRDVGQGELIMAAGWVVVVVCVDCAAWPSFGSACGASHFKTLLRRVVLLRTTRGGLPPASPQAPGGQEKERGVSASAVGVRGPLINPY
jgi:hypothetical protein